MEKYYAHTRADIFHDFRDNDVSFEEPLCTFKMVDYTYPFYNLLS